MTPLESRPGSRSNPVTVADLLDRNAPVPVKVDTGEAAPIVSVGSLLRREGRAPHKIDRPVRPRAHQQAEVAVPATARTRRSTRAAGTVLAVSSVLGAAILTDATPTGRGSWGGGDGGVPGEERLGPEGNALASPRGVLTDSVLPDALRAGPDLTTSWMPVAFQSAVIGLPGDAGATPGLPVSGGSVGRAVSPASFPQPPATGGFEGAGPSAGRGIAAAPLRGPSAPGPTGGPSDGSTGGGGPTGTSDGLLGGGAGSPLDEGDTVAPGAGAAVGGVVTDVGGALPAPVALPVQRVGSTAGALDGVVGRTTSSLGGAVEPVIAPVRPVVEPVAETVAPVAKAAAPVVDTVAPVVEAAAPVVDTVAPVVAPVSRTLTSVVAPADPVTALVAPESTASRSKTSGSGSSGSGSSGSKASGSNPVDPALSTLDGTTAKPSGSLGTVGSVAAGVLG